MPILIIILIAITIAAFIIWNQGKNKFSENEIKLIKRCYGDESQAERLINFELNKNPNLSRTKAADYAYKLIIRDNR